MLSLSLNEYGMSINGRNYNNGFNSIKEIRDFLNRLINLTNDKYIINALNGALNYLKFDEKEIVKAFDTYGIEILEIRYKEFENNLRIIDRYFC